MVLSRLALEESQVGSGREGSSIVVYEEKKDRKDSIASIAEMENVDENT